ncbi:unnamed protein product [Sphagnum jensenii]|uniref:Uncharacterized protein n=1 Tax=Sphagnum jensenii TaxID=128206 RepID=A0ABP0V8F2_9BRYO
MVLCVVCAVAYIRRNDGAPREYAEKFSDMAASLKIAQDAINKVNESNGELLTELKAIKTVADSMFADHGKRITEIENRKPLTQLNDVNLRFKEPLQVSVVYRQAVKKTAGKPLFDSSTVLTGSPLPQTMLHRAGITNNGGN